MKGFQAFLLGLVMVLLALLTGVISLYAVNPDFAAYVNEQMNKEPKEDADTSAEEGTADIGPEAEELASGPEDEGSRDAAQDDDEGILEGLTDEYSAPSEDELEIPEGFAEKTGYEDIRVTEETVTDEEADRIEEELSTGPLGDEFDFDPEFYPYYQMLDDRGKGLYRQIYANMLELNPAFKSTDPLMGGRRIGNAFEAVFNDHPELFWIDTQYRTVYKRNGDFIELDLFYNETADNIEASRSGFEAAADSIISGASGSDPDKERYVHNRLAELFEYQRNPLDQSAYSGLVDNKTVCAGYARAFSYIMTKLGVPCYLCTGYAGEAHGWNIIKLDGEYYNVDLTWDDTGTDEPYYFDWYNKTDDDYGLTHIRKSLSVHLPPCNGTKYREPEHEKEEDPESEDLPSLEDFGLSEADVISDMQLYYDALYDRLYEQGKGSYTLDMAISESILEECSAAYDSAEVKDKVLGRVLQSIGGSRANISCTPVKLKGGYCLLRHNVTIL